VTTIRHTWFLTVRQARNLMREPIWIVLLLVQPMVWLVLYGQLFKNVTRLGGFGTTSYITFLAPAIVVMNASSARLERHVDDRRPRPQGDRALPRDARVSALARALADRPLGADGRDSGGDHPGRLDGARRRIHTGVAGWVVIILVAILVTARSRGISQAIALLTRARRR
jgi:hypothetical protein